jgi:hypothetical protein
MVLFEPQSFVGTFLLWNIAQADVESSAKSYGVSLCIQLKLIYRSTFCAGEDVPLIMGTAGWEIGNNWTTAVGSESDILQTEICMQGKELKAFIFSKA